MKTIPRIGVLVVLNDEPDAAMFRVTRVGHFTVGLIDGEDPHPNQRIEWIDVSLVKYPSIKQLQAYKGRIS